VQRRLFGTAIQQEADERLHGAVFGLAAVANRTTMLALAAAALANRLGNAGHVAVVAGAVVPVVAAFLLARTSLPAATASAKAPLRSNL
jgi:hypothetical protein